MKNEALSDSIIVIACAVIIAVFVTNLGSCKQQKQDTKYKSSSFELRQLVKETETRKTTHGSYFLIGGSFTQTEQKYTTIKVFALVEKRYRLIEMPFDKIRISINNNIKKPFIIVEYENEEKLTDEDLISDGWYDKVYVINCPEQYLPEKLLPIEL